MLFFAQRNLFPRYKITLISPKRIFFFSCSFLFVVGKTAFMQFTHSTNYSTVFFAFLFKVFLKNKIQKSIYFCFSFYDSVVYVSKPREKFEQLPFHTMYHSKWWILWSSIEIFCTFASPLSLALSLSLVHQHVCTCVCVCEPKRISISLP